ncbi:MAG TPA: TonB family protein, partial [Candidatus Limnocylindrales bacterium]|nr:TonB family protein [Candidatus Limnocylindrales bacterium]
WVTARPAEYWKDALVHRPVAWTQMRQSFLGHVLAVLAVYWITLLWINRPQVLPQEVRRTTITHYELSEYLPAITPKQEKPAPPVRRHAQKADPEHAPQEIVSIHMDHNSTRQTIVQANPNLLTQDVPLPNMVISTVIPGAPVAASHPLQKLPLDLQQPVAPAEQTVERNVSRLIFPLAARPEVVPPANAVAAVRSLPQLPQVTPEVVAPAGRIEASHAMTKLPDERPAVIAPPSAVAQIHAVPLLPAKGPVVIPPSETPVARNTRRLRIPVQAPEVAQPAEPIASRRTLAASLPMSAPEVVPPPARAVSRRNLERLGVTAQAQTVVPPPPPIANGAGPEQEKAMGQLLALNARPVAPVGPVSVPEGNRKGEFAAGPEGRPNASARPEIKEGEGPSAARDAGKAADSPDIFIAPPPIKVAANAVVAFPPEPARVTASPDRADLRSDRIDNQIFGARQRYSIRLSMPNLNSAMGSWTMRFAKLNSAPGQEENISAPEPLRKVDPAYPASMMEDRIEGVVVLYAVIHTDGSVGDVRVLEGFDPRLDQNACSALRLWRFRPGTKNGVPIDVEAVVRVPFRVAKRSY